MTIRFGVSMPDELVAQIDKKRGDISRSRFLRRAAEELLKVIKK